MKPAKLKEHLTFVPLENASKDEIYSCEENSIRKSGALLKLDLPFHKKLLKASCKISCLIYKQKKPRALEMVELVSGLDRRKKLEVVSFSNDVIRSGIVDISFNVLKHAIEELVASPIPFSRRLYETTDISQYSQLLVFLHHAHASTEKKRFTRFTKRKLLRYLVTHLVLLLS
jgi:hypothetical protein